MKQITRTLRPKKFSDVIGQKNSVDLIQNALKSDLMLPVCVIYGSSGVGKTTLARLIAMWQCCVQRNDNEPCGKCDNCAKILTDTHEDVLELDGGSDNSVEDIRTKILQTVNYSTAMYNTNNKKVYILDEVHMLSKNAITALLKTFEEELNNVQFVLATTNVEKLSKAILSRSFQVRLDPLKRDLLENYILKICKEIGAEIDSDSLKYISYVSNGSLRQAIVFLQQISILTEAKITADRTKDFFGLASFDVIDKFIKIFEEGDLGGFNSLIKDINQVDHENFIQQLLSSINTKVSESKASEQLIKIGNSLAEASVLIHKSPYSKNMLEICIGNAFITNIKEKKPLSEMVKGLF